MSCTDARPSICEQAYAMLAHTHRTCELRRIPNHRRVQNSCAYEVTRRATLTLAGVCCRCCLPRVCFHLRQEQTQQQTRYLFSPHLCLPHLKLPNSCLSTPRFVQQTSTRIKAITQDPLTQGTLSLLNFLTVSRVSVYHSLTHSQPKPTVMSPPGYEGASRLAESRHAYGGHARNKPQPPVAPLQALPEEAAPAGPIPAFSTAIATKQQIAAEDAAQSVKPPAAELAVVQGAKLKKDVEDHTASFSKAVANAVENTRELLRQLRDSTPNSKVVDGLWQELEQLFEAANTAKTALPQFMENQRGNMNLFHSSMMHETIQETQAELNFQHKKLNTQNDLLLKQQEAFQSYRARTDSSLKELESLQERVSRLTLEKGNFKTEVDKYKAMLEQEIASKAEDRKTSDALQKELETLVASKKQLETENETLRKTTTDTLGQLKDTEQKLNKDIVRLQTEHRLLGVKYNNQASEHAGTMTVSPSLILMFGQC